MFGNRQFSITMPMAGFRLDALSVPGQRSCQGGPAVLLPNLLIFRSHIADDLPGFDGAGDHFIFVGQIDRRLQIFFR